MPKQSKQSRAAAHEILAAITQGTSKVGAKAFFNGLLRRLTAYKPDRYAVLTKWLRDAGIQHLPSPEQCTAAAKIARRKHGPVVAPHPVRADY
ncbi:MAG TPA: hypothetical protein VL403_18265 [Candidatus Kryptonia bacterium]|nr:hypothetical protein [Candidatus Kryptonia bacterium]